jgi:DNA end-binding protein Ku
MGELKLPPVQKAKTKEQEVALQLINQLTVKFDISKYKDTYTEKLLKIIQQKAKTGKAPKAPKLQVVHKQDNDDLMSMLKASLGGARKKAS